jgi:uncharacterized protein involved in exopolysaccharide biosynthesis
MNNSFFNSLELFRLLHQWRKHLIVVALISLAGSVIFSSPAFIKPRFKSYAIVYPSNLIAYSTESATEQMLQIAQSSDIRNRVIEAFDLYTHYEIDTAKNDHFHSDAIKQYEENVTIKQTEYESMEITVYDTDPLVASRMVDSIIHYFDIKARAMQAEKSAEVLVIAREQLDKKQAEIDSLEARVKEYRMNYNLLDYKAQSAEAYRGYFRNLASGNARGAAEAKAIIEALKDKGGEFYAMNENLWRFRGTYNDLKVEYDNAYRDVFKKLTYANVVTRPQPADKKSYPIRWLIVLISVSSSVFVAFMALLIWKPRTVNA